MGADAEENTIQKKYRVELVEKTDPPEGMPEGSWYRYVIGQGRSQVVGFKPGSLKDVTEHAETIAGEFNERAAGRKSPYAARKKQS